MRRLLERSCIGLAAWAAIGATASAQTAGGHNDRPAPTAVGKSATPATTALRTGDTQIPNSDSPEQVARMEAILRRWEAVSEQNVTLCAKFKRTDSTKFGSVQKYEGEALFRKPNLACLEWKQVVQDKDGNDKRVFTERIVCGGDKVYQMLGPTKQVMVYTLPHDERRRALEEGPVPFLFNMRMDQAKSRYRWRLLREEAPTKGTPGFYYVEIRPLHPIDMEEFSVAWVKLNQATLLPEALQLFAPNGGKDKRTYEFLDVERNGANNMANNPGNFDGEQMANEFAKFGYKIIINANPVPDEATPKLGARPSAAGEPPARNNRPFGRR